MTEVNNNNTSRVSELKSEINLLQNQNEKLKKELAKISINK